MKIAITGHSAGIGQALAKQYENRGHEIVGLSKRHGDNIRNIPKIIEKIKDCDMFINNAQSGYAQTELLFEICKIWRDIPNKHIINISTMMTLNPTVDEASMIEYKNQKQALESAHWDLAHRQEWPQMVLVKPGEVKTGEWSGPKACNVDKWAEKVVDTLERIDSTLKVYELSLGVDYTYEP
jgi:NAD(P)-dependent dehydrogenase (short-subunit alcohol dehydrogenase family)